MEMRKASPGILLESFRKKIERRLKSEEEKICLYLSEIQKNFRCELQDNEAKSMNGNHLADFNASPGNNDLIRQQTENCKKRLWKIRMALWRLELGKYGICKYCREPIPLARLEKIPYTDSHSACKDASRNKR